MTTLRSDSVVDLLGAWSTGPAPLNEQLAAGIQHVVERGALPAGTRLPSERQLSGALGVSRTTVVAAYDRLRTAGLLRSRRGSGTVVEAHLIEAPRAPADEVPGWGPELAIAGDGFGVAGDAIGLTIGAFPGPQLIAEETERAAREDLPALLRSFGYLPTGLPALRAAIAAHLTGLGVASSADEVMVTTGAQQAVDILARALVGPDSSVILENPTYSGAIDAFRASGARLTGVPVDDGGIVVDIVRLQAERRRGQLLYVVPSFQNPTGTVMPEHRRRELATLSDEHAMTIVEDLTASYLSYGQPPPAPIGSHDPGGRVITIGSLSKVAWGGLRIGWIRAPREVIDRLGPLKARLDLGSSMLAQAICVRLFDRFDELRSITRATAAERRLALEEALRERLPSWTWREPEGGFCLWVRLPAGDGTAFARVAASHGVIVRPGAGLSVDGSFRDHIRLAFGEDPPTLRAAVDRLATAWAAFEPRSTRAPAGMTISV